MSIIENSHIFTIKIFIFSLVEFIKAKLQNPKVYNENIFTLWKVSNENIKQTKKEKASNIYIMTA